MVEVRELILNKAQERVERFGFKKTTMDELSKDCGISKKTLYGYFKDKEDLFASLLQRETHRTLDILFARVTEITDAVEKLTLLIKNAVSYFNEDNFMTKMVKDRDLVYNFMTPNCQCFLDDEIIARLSGIIHEGVEQGKFRQVDEQLVAYAGYKLFESFSYNCTSSLLATKEENYNVDVLLDFILHAIVEPAELSKRNKAGSYNRKPGSNA